MRAWLPFVGFLVACDPASTASPDASDERGRDAAPGIDAAVTAADAAPDAPPCVPTPAVKATGVDLDNVDLDHPLALDGVGTRCDQLVRAILDPAQRPPAYAKLDATVGLQPPLCTELATRTAVAIDVHAILGQRLLSTRQYLRAWVDNATTTLDEIQFGFFIEPPALAPHSCTEVDTTLAAVTGHKLVFSSFQGCVPTGGGVWEIQDDDPRTHVGSGLYYLGEHLRVVREIAVTVHPSNITQALLDSDLNCFGSIGIILIVDAETGEILDTRRHCIVCLTQHT